MRSLRVVGRLMLVAAMPQPSLVAIYLLVFANMAARTFEQPLMQALLPRWCRGQSSTARSRRMCRRAPVGADRAFARGVLYVFGPVFDYGSVPRWCSPPSSPRC